jgi:hypothetical protein
MSKNQVCITLTQKELKYLDKRAFLKKKTLYKSLQADINRVIGGIEIKEDVACIGNNERINKTLDIPPRLWKIAVCLSTKLGITPGQLIYRLIVAPHLPEIIKEDSLEAEVVTAN